MAHKRAQTVAPALALSRRARLDLSRTLSQVSKWQPITLKHASHTLRPLIRPLCLPLRRMLHWRTVSSATRFRSGYQQSTRHWLHTDSGHPRRPSRHAQFYSELVPAMIPVALLGSAVYMVCSSTTCRIRAHSFVYSI